MDHNRPGIHFISRGDSLSRRAYSALREAIRDGVVVPDTIYSEAQLARLLGVSRTPVREALIELAGEGTVDKMPQRGFRLRAITEESRTEAFELRALIEGYVAERLARIASEADVSRLRSILDRQEEAAGDVSAFLDADEEFHLTMADIAGLERARQMLIGLRPVFWLSGVAALSRPDRNRAVTNEHRAIVDRCSAHDAAGARRAVRDHILRTARAIRMASGAPHGRVSGLAIRRPPPNP